MEYLTNEKLLKQQQSALFSINNSRSNSVSRFPIPSQRAVHDPVQPLRSADLFNKLEDILKQKQLSTTTRKRQKQISCILNSQACNDDKKQQNIEASYYKSPIRLVDVQTNGFIDLEIEDKLYLLDHLHLTNQIKVTKREILFKINFKKIQIKKKKRVLKGLKQSLIICKKRLEAEIILFYLKNKKILKEIKLKKEKQI
ncbi:unnamed protein product [Paramecium pentaurelia]|uniref:Uncharacterized protein n=1 Tax=Paramecium pentaurelia TaxID=43138 RepID=A0A8S1X257_9CILI|nr:unnamed protein product [Paramecium pentaurelia]